MTDKIGTLTEQEIQLFDALYMAEQEDPDDENGTELAHNPYYCGLITAEDLGEDFIREYLGSYGSRVHVRS